jgi:endo-1,4-beta-xylanase
MHRYIKIAMFLIAIAAATVIGTVVALQPRTPTLPSPPLKDLAARHGIQIGNFAIRSRLHEKPYTDILTNQFNLALADNTPNWYFTDGGLRPTRDTYNFVQMDEVVGFAEKHGMPIQAHHFLWGDEKWLPDWLKKGDFSRDELMHIIEDHIKTVGQRYKGRIGEWTVVNEAFSRGQHMYGLHDWWGDAVGDQSYIDAAFTWARQADPHAKLILNDFQNEALNDVFERHVRLHKSCSRTWRAHRRYWHANAHRRHASANKRRSCF